MYYEITHYSSDNYTLLQLQRSVMRLLKFCNRWNVNNHLSAATGPHAVSSEV
jgi:hypothetical protein